MPPAGCSCDSSRSADEERRNADDGNPEEADERVGDRDGERRQRRRHQREGIFGAQDGKDLPEHRGSSAGYSSAPTAASTASTTAPERTSSSAWRISVAYQRSPSRAGGIAARMASSAARVPLPTGKSLAIGSTRVRACAAIRSSPATICSAFSTITRALLPHQVEFET